MAAPTRRAGAPRAVHRVEPRPRHPGACRAVSAFRNLQEAGCEDGAATRGHEKKKEKDEATSPGQDRPDNPGRGHAKDRSKAKDKNSDGDDSGDQGGDATED